MYFENSVFWKKNAFEATEVEGSVNGFSYRAVVKPYLTKTKVFTSVSSTADPVMASWLQKSLRAFLLYGGSCNSHQINKFIGNSLTN